MNNMVSKILRWHQVYLYRGEFDTDHWRSNNAIGELPIWSLLIKLDVPWEIVFNKVEKEMATYTVIF